MLSMGDPIHLQILVYDTIKWYGKEVTRRLHPEINPKSEGRTAGVEHGAVTTVQVQVSDFRGVVAVLLGSILKPGTVVSLDHFSLLKPNKILYT